VNQIGWVEKRLGEVCLFENGDRGKNYPSKSVLVDEGIPFVNAGHLVDDRVSLAKMNYITEERYNLLGSGKFQQGDILFCLRGSLGKFGTVGEEVGFGAIASSLVIVRADTTNKDPGLFHGYLRLYFSSPLCREMIDRYAGGAAQPNLGARDLAKFVIPLPPLPEQKQIVAILDKAFAAIDQAVANAERNLTNARELFESYLNKVFTERGEGWVEKRLGEIADFKNGLNFTKSSQGEKVRVVGVRDFKNNYWVPTDCLDTVQIDGELNKAYELKENDILVVRSNGNKQLIGRVLLVGKVNDKSSHSGFTIRVRVHVQGVDARYLAHYMKSESIRDMLVSSGEGANISSLNQKALSVLPIAFPNSDEQVVIVNRIELLGVELKKLETIYQQKLTALTEFKQSILQKAFRGELTAGDSYG